MSRLLCLKIRIKRIRPFIWRKILMSDSCTFGELHEIIQQVMGWENYHLFEFRIGDIRITPPNCGHLREDELDPNKVSLNKFIFDKGQRLEYVYDFGDNWVHDVLVERVEDEGSWPVCIGGKRACPPEDCGGVFGYCRLFEIKQDNSHPEYGDMIINWLGEDHDFEEFDLDKLNKRLGNG